RRSAYGNWEFVKAKNDAMDWTFRPYGRVRKWWHKHFPELPTLGLPITSAKLRTYVTNKLPWETFIVTEEIGSNMKRSHPGFCCPWCGAWLRANEITSLGLECPFCLIKSFISG